LTRLRAYRARLRYADYQEWAETVYAFASMKNASVIADEFSRGAMSETEVSQIAKSIARWVWARITPEQTQVNRQRWAKNLEQGRKKKMNERLEILEVMNYERT
ncbi:hypothetical protein, partial [Rothia terrae]|uniref:hypothetical protein n=1 Tax=Rothia terrae TaxID=396015 RepID=UPI0033C08027